MDILYIVIPIVLVGLITGIEDIIKGKIRNIWVILLLVYGFLLYSYLHYKGIILTSELNIIFINLFVTIIIAILLWKYTFWSGGDAKLFIAFSFLIPPFLYIYSFDNIFTVFTLFFNMAIIGFLSIIFKIFKNLKSIHFIQILSEYILYIRNYKRIILILLKITGIYWLINIIINTFLFDYNSLILNIFMIIISIYFISKLKLNIQWIIVSLLVFIRIIFDKDIFSFNSIFLILIVAVIWIIIESTILNNAIKRLIYENYTKLIKTNDLKENMIFAERILTFKNKKEFLNFINNHSNKFHKTFNPPVKINGQYYSFISSFSELKGEYPLNYNSLDKKDIKFIKRLEKPNINIIETIPFSPLITISTLLTILFKGNILIGIIYLLL
jgi:hypothetical protein